MKRLLLIFILILSCDIFGQGFNEDKTAFSNYLKRMFNNSPFEGVKIVDDYDKQYLISLVALDKSKYKSHSVLNRVAQVKARQQASTFINGSTISSDLIIRTSEPKVNDTTKTVTEMIESIKENSLGFVEGMELLCNFDSDQDNRAVFIYMRELEEDLSNNAKN